MVDPEKLALLQKVVNDRADGSGMSGGELLAEGSGASGGALLSAAGLVGGATAEEHISRLNEDRNNHKLSKVLTLSEKEKTGLSMEQQEKLIKEKQDKVKAERSARLKKIKEDNPDKFPEKGSDAAKQRAKDAAATKSKNAEERAKVIELEEKKSGIRMVGADRLVYEALLKSQQKTAKNASRYKTLKEEAIAAGFPGVAAYQKAKKDKKTGVHPGSPGNLELTDPSVAHPAYSGKGRAAHPALRALMGV